MISDDPYVDKVLQNKTLFFDEFIRSFENYLKINTDDSSSSSKNEINEKYKQNKTFQVFNISPTLLDIFKHFYSFVHFEQNLSIALTGFNLKGFQNCKPLFLSSTRV